MGVLSFLFNLFGQNKISNPPEWSYDKTIYEVNLRQFSEGGTIKEFSEHLERLNKLGVGILWFMPIHPIGEVNRKGTLGSYYSVKDYKALDPNYGTSEEFKELVNKAHSLGMYVILDWVANHTSWDNKWITEHPEFYTRNDKNEIVSPVDDWHDVADLNYDNKELWNAMIDALSYWIMEYDIDGFRCDVAEMVPHEFWVEAISELNKIKPVFMLAEGADPKLIDAGFHMVYNWDVHHLMTEIASGKKSAIDLKNQILSDKKKYKNNSFQMQFTSNHDENSWKGTEFQRLGDGVNAFAVIAATIPDMLLIYSGQEAGYDKQLDFFEKDPIQWKDSPFKDFYTKLNKLKKNNKALRNGNKGGEIIFLNNGKENEVITFLRESEGDKVVVVVNLSNKNQSVRIRNERLPGDYNELFSNDFIFIDQSMEFNLKPWGYEVLTNR